MLLLSHARDPCRGSHPFHLPVDVIHREYFAEPHAALSLFPALLRWIFGEPDFRESAAVRLRHHAIQVGAELFSDPKFPPVPLRPGVRRVTYVLLLANVPDR